MKHGHDLTFIFSNLKIMKSSFPQIFRWW